MARAGSKACGDLYVISTVWSLMTREESYSATAQAAWPMLWYAVMS